MNNKELAELDKSIRVMSNEALANCRSEHRLDTNIHAILADKEFERRARIAQHELDRKIIAEQVRWMKFAASRKSRASIAAIIAAIVGAIAGALLALWLQPSPTPKQSESPLRSAQQGSAPSKPADRTEKAESVPSKSP